MVLLTCALLLDMLVGDPDWLWRRAPHPVVWIGNFIGWADELQFRWVTSATLQFIAGVLLLVTLAAMSWAAVTLIWLLPTWIAVAVELVLTAILIAQRSLSEHVSRVAKALREDGLAGGRHAVSMIVGRDVSQLQESGVAVASIESCAENFSDGVVAPVFWYALLGLPGIVFYKAVNTADSMIGHRDVKHEWFGKPAARLDDAMNWPAARLSAALIWVASLTMRSAPLGEILRKTLRDARLHRSPNAGWPEAAFAASLGVALGGPRIYHDGAVDAPFLNAEGRRELGVGDIDRAVSLLWRSGFVLLALVAAVAVGGFVFR